MARYFQLSLRRQPIVPFKSRNPMIKKTYFALLTALFSITSVSSHAASNRTPAALNPLVYGGLSFGGETLATFGAKNGSDSELKSGGFWSFGAGMRLFFPNNKNLITDVTLGYKFDSLDASNGDKASMSRFVLNLIPYYVNGKHLFGVGPTLHFNTTYEDNFAANFFGFDYQTTTEIDFGSNIGLVLDYGHRGRGEVVTGIKVTLISYSIESASISGLGAVDAPQADFDDLDGNSAELYMSYAF